MFSAPGAGYDGAMTIGTSLFLIAIGAILRYAVADSWDAIDLTTAGLILMVVGAIGLAISFFYSMSRDGRDRGRVVREVREDPPPPR